MQTTYFIPNLKMGKYLTGKCHYLYRRLNKSYWEQLRRKRKISCPSWYYIFSTVLIDKVEVTSVDL